MKFAFAAALGVGLVLYAISLMLPSSRPGSWTEQDAKELQDLHAAAHAASFQREAVKGHHDEHAHGHSHDVKDTRSYEELEKALADKRNQLTAAQSNGVPLKTVFFWLGLVLAFGGGAGFLAAEPIMAAVDDAKSK